MRIAISNLAWDMGDEPRIARVLQDAGVGGVEIAPTKVWPDPLAASPVQIAGYRRFWSDHGIAIVAMQALLFGRPDLTIFESAERRRHTAAYLQRVAQLGAALGARALVFGSPKNRRVDGMPPEQALEVATEFFAEVGRSAHEAGVSVCIEANPPQYDCDFITTTTEAAALVRTVGSPGFQLHLDAGGMELTGEDADAAVNAAMGILRHVHASEPFLEPLDRDTAIHRRLAAALHAHGYDRWVSVEMRGAKGPAAPDHVFQAITVARELYAADQPR